MIRSALTRVGSAGIAFSLVALASAHAHAGTFQGRGEGVVTNCGRLQVKDAHVCAENGTPISLGGMSWFWSGWAPKYFNANTVNYLVDNFKISVARATYGCPANSGPQGDVQDIKNLVEAAIARNIYVIIDWHGEGQMTPYKDQEKAFFTEMVKTYGNNPHVLYELWNEPTDQSDFEIQALCQDVTNTIRSVESQMGYQPHLIICGSRSWSQYPNSYTINDPGNNVAYTFHGYFEAYGGGHYNQLLANVPAAMGMGHAVFVTEYGADYGTHTNTDKAIQFCQDNNISMCAWSVNDKPEPWSIFTSNMDSLTAIGSYYQDKNSNWKPVPPMKKIYPTAVALDKNTLMIPVVGAKAKLTPVFTPQDATETACTWTTSAPGIATVDANGNVTGIATGDATLTVTAKDEQGSPLTATCLVSVKNMKNVALNATVTASSVESGAPANVQPQNAVDGNTTTRWSSAFADPQWFQVDLGASYKIYNVALNWEGASAKDYIVEGSKDGAAWTPLAAQKGMANGARVDSLDLPGAGFRFLKMTGTARTTAYGYSLYEFSAYGEPDEVVKVTGVKFAAATVPVGTNATYQLAYTVSPSNATNKAVLFKSDNPSIVSVDAAGLVKGVAQGSTTVTVTTVDGGFSDKCTVNVTDIKVTGVAVSPTTASLFVGDSRPLTTTVLPANATNKAVTYSSSAPGVASVDASGAIKALAKGQATITAKTVDGAYTATCVVNVDDAWSLKTEAENFTWKTDSPHAENCAEGGQNMGWINNGDFMIYPVNIPKAGTYVITYRVASPNGSGQVILGRDGVDKSPTLSIPNTGAWQNWTTITTTAILEAGPQNLTVYAKTGGWNLNWWSISTK